MMVFWMDVPITHKRQIHGMWAIIEAHPK